MKIKEIFIDLSYEDDQQLLKNIANLILKYETNLTLKLILHDIDVRNKQGEGLMTPNVLSVHVQDELVDKDIVFYVTLDKKYKYFSKSLNQQFQIDKLVVIVVNPQHKLDHLSKLEDFIA
ncbi:PTS sugar transporter subunit IIA [Lactobacillus amylovorus]|uniref:PTS sugar transporter subunit IIA n=1 Tax=Lactobacillus amylovorus TaxID=1604 RepID=UPI00232BCC00|nr:PTS sugar transporter subunit IIA [Lactobacillus amylovorus]MDB6255138.1 PTS sugar transporter subunit IIA [Lactobacillus amylovorus]